MQIKSPAKPTNCQFIQLGGPPSDWDIQHYANGIADGGKIGRLPGTELQQHPAMRPWGRSRDGEVALVAHMPCYKLLLGVIDAARHDHNRAADFERDHPSQRYTRQQAAAGEREPEVSVARDYGERQRRVRLSLPEQTARLADEACAVSLRDLNLRGAHIPLLNEEMLAEVAAGLEMASPQGGSGRTVCGPASTSTGGATTSQFQPPMVQKKAHRAKPPPSKYAPLSRLSTDPRGLLKAAKSRGTELRSVKKALKRQSSQYQAQLSMVPATRTRPAHLPCMQTTHVTVAVCLGAELKRGAKEKLLETTTALGKANRALSQLKARVKVFDDARDILAEAGMRVRPHAERSHVCPRRQLTRLHCVYPRVGRISRTSMRAASLTERSTLSASLTRT